MRLLREWEQSLSNDHTDNNSSNTETTTDTTNTGTGVHGEATSTNTSSDQQQQQQHHQQEQTQDTVTATAATLVTVTSTVTAIKRHQFVAVMSADLNDSAVSVLTKGCDAYLPKPVSITCIPIQTDTCLLSTRCIIHW